MFSSLFLKNKPGESLFSIPSGADDSHTANTRCVVEIPHCTECREDLQYASTVSNVIVDLLLELPSYVIKHHLI